MERSAEFHDDLAAYSAATGRLSSAFDAYTTPDRPYEDLGRELEEAAGDYLGSAAPLLRGIGDLGRDADGTRALVAMIGIDMMVLRQSALTAWYLDETDGQAGRGDATPKLQPAELADLLPGLEEATTEFLAEIGGTAPPPIAGASQSAPPGPDRTVAPSVDKILDTAGGDIEGFLKVGAAAGLGAIAAEALQLWSAAPQQADQLFGSRRLRWVAGKAVEAARDKLKVLWQVAGDLIPQLVTEFGEEVRKALFKAGLTEGLGRLLEEQQIVMESNTRLADPSLTTGQVQSALLAARRVVDDHEHWRRWFPAVNVGSRALSLLPLPGKRYFIVLATFVMVALSVWLAAAYAGSARLPLKLKLGIRGIPDLVDDSLGLPDAVARAEAEKREKALRDLLAKDLRKAQADAQGIWKMAGRDPKGADALVSARLGASEDELRGKLCALAGMPTATPANELLLGLRKALETSADESMEAVVSLAIARLK